MPLVVMSATRAPLRWISVLVPTVVPWPICAMESFGNPSRSSSVAGR